ncbi:hypothetical protein IMZ48_17135, partial [Candidatus Bathyarchaeota archaeon]|nr:hypothetical protein [Candidatus Bathyarchaeota archaeon]
MATTCEPARVVDTTANPANASPRLLAVAGLDDHAAPPHPDLTPEPSDPPPNPPFSFPAGGPASAPPSFSRATGRRPQSTIETNKLPSVMPGVKAVRSSRPSLPAFSFNPAGASSSQPDNGFLSPPLSPPLFATIGSSSRPGGHRHRRGGSEYVGGSIRGGDSIMSISPTNPESEPAPA